MQRGDHMLKLSNKSFLSISRLLKDKARNLDKYLFEYNFQKGSSKNY